MPRRTLPRRPGNVRLQSRSEKRLPHSSAVQNAGCPSNRLLRLVDQGWQDFLEHMDWVSSMSRCGNCHDNAVAESFFQLIKRERIKRRIYANRNWPGKIPSTTSRCSTIQSAVTGLMKNYRRSSLRNGISNGSEVSKSRKLLAIQIK